MDQFARKLKPDDATIGRILDWLDEDESEEQGRLRHEERYPYRVRALQVDVRQSRDMCTSYIVPARNIGSQGISFLIGNAVHVGWPCTVHLITIRNNWQTVTGQVASCRYIQGSACVHEVNVHFDRAIDPASFAPTAVKSRVLLADDSAMARRLMTHLLELLNAEVCCAGNGIEAIQKAEAETFDIVLMDIEMPELDGISAVQLLRSKGYVRTIVAVSSLSDVSVRDQALLAGCDDFLAKPLQLESLQAVINRTRPEPLVSALLHMRDMHALIDEFVACLPDCIRALESAFASEDRELLAREVRKLKGEGTGFGFEPITNAAANVEAAIRTNMPFPELRLKLRELIRYCLAARPATWDPRPLTSHDECRDDAGDPAAPEDVEPGNVRRADVQAASAR